MYPTEHDTMNTTPEPMSNTNYKLICKYAGDCPITVGKEYSYKCDDESYTIVADDGTARYFLANGGWFLVTKYFDLVPVDAEKPKLKVTDLGENECIHCTTESEAKAICKLNGNGEHSYKLWKIHREETAFKPVTNGWHTVNFQKSIGNIVYPASDFLDATPDPIEPEVGQLWTCQVLDRPNLTIGKAYRITSGNSKELWIKSDNGSTSLYSKKDFINRFRFHSDPTEKAPEPIMVQPADYIDPKLLEVYNALDDAGKAIMREKMPDVKWPEPVRYATYADWRDDNSFEIKGTSPETVVICYDTDKYTPEINGGEIRFRVNE